MGLKPEGKFNSQHEFVYFFHYISEGMVNVSAPLKCSNVVDNYQILMQGPILIIKRFENAWS